MTDIKKENFEYNVDEDQGSINYTNSSEPKESYSEKPLTGFWKFIDIISLQKDTAHLKASERFLINEDLQPVLDEAKRPWGWFNFVSFWIADAFNVNTWQIASTGVVAGLSWWEVWISVWLGYFFVSCFLQVSQRIGSHYHISFPVSCRTSFGNFGSIWPIINRVVMAIVWTAVQSWIGGQCVQLMLKSIFGKDLDTRIHNSIPGSGTTTFQFLSYFLFCLFQVPFIYCKPQTVRHLFTIKAYACSTAGVAFLIWTCVRAKNIGETMREPTSLKGSAHAWAFINSTMNCLANFATLIVNAPDFTRLAKTPRSAGLSQFIAIPVCFGITCLIGILASSASGAMFGKDNITWSPLDLMDRYVDSYSRGDRGGVFLIAFAFSLAQIGTNISANTISAGTDMSALLPRFINIRRGGMICAAIAFALCPWNFFTSASNFTTYLSAYAVFLSSIAGVVSADYLLVRRGYINVYHLFTNKKGTNYAYNKIGVNWRAYVAYICGILPNVVGFAGATGDKVPIGATYVYNLSFFAGYIVAFLLYAILCTIFPIEHGVPVKNVFTEPGWYEQNAIMHMEDDDFTEEAKKDHPNEFIQTKFRLFG